MSCGGRRRFSARAHTHTHTHTKQTQCVATRKFRNPTSNPPPPPPPPPPPRVSGAFSPAQARKIQRTKRRDANFRSRAQTASWRRRSCCRSRRGGFAAQRLADARRWRLFVFANKVWRRICNQDRVWASESNKHRRIGKWGGAVRAREFKEAGGMGWTETARRQTERLKLRTPRPTCSRRAPPPPPRG
jgi:hypothetical protein